MNWFKNNRRKKGASESTPKPVLDLSGKRARKPSPLQPHQAYSVKYYQDEKSPLRPVVEDLWNRRKEKAVIDLLAPHMVGEKGATNRMLFHNAVMRLKHSELSESEKQKLQEWIDEEVEDRWDAARYPWKNPDGTDAENLTAENQYVQRSVSVPYRKVPVSSSVSCINALPQVLQTALEEVERITGLKSVLLIGGPIPSLDGQISTFK